MPDLLIWLVVGALVGGAATLLEASDYTRKEDRHLPENMFVALIGSVIGGLASRIFDSGQSAASNFTGAVFAGMGAALLLWLVRNMRRNV